MTERNALLETLRGVGAANDADIGLAETALVLAALDRPDGNIEDYRSHLDALAGDTARALGDTAGIEEGLAAFRRVVYADHGYAGDAETYDDMQNANLMSVIDRRKGLPVALGILCIHAARAHGWDMAGTGFPSHFMVRLRVDGRSIFLDPFNGGASLDEVALQRRLRELHGDDAELDPSFYLPVSNRAVLLRLQNIIKLRALHDSDAGRTLEVLESMVALAPREPTLRRDMALLSMQTGNLKSAIRTLEEFFHHAGPGLRDHELAGLLEELKGRLN